MTDRQITNLDAYSQKLENFEKMAQLKVLLENRACYKFHKELEQVWNLYTNNVDVFDLVVETLSYEEMNCEIEDFDKVVKTGQRRLRDRHSRFRKRFITWADSNLSSTWADLVNVLFRSMYREINNNDRRIIFNQR